MGSTSRRTTQAPRQHDKQRIVSHNARVVGCPTLYAGVHALVGCPTLYTGVHALVGCPTLYAGVHALAFTSRALFKWGGGGGRGSEAAADMVLSPKRLVGFISKLENELHQ